MVKSIINESIQYKESRQVDEEDLGYSSQIYGYDLFNKRIEFVTGKEKYLFTNKNVIYFPLYLIINDKPISKIGIFEIDSQKLIHALDEDGDIDFSNGNILFFNFVDQDFLNKQLSKQKIIISDKKASAHNEDADDDSEDESDDDEDVNNVLKLKLPTQYLKNEKRNTISSKKNDIYTIDTSHKSNMMLLEETEEHSLEIKSEYHEASNNNWVEKFMTNNNYDIIDVESNGDCFFATIREAFLQIGRKTTVDKLRIALSNEVTDEEYMHYRELYMMFLEETQFIEKKIKDNKRTMGEMKKRLSTADRDESVKIREEAKMLVQEHKKHNAEKDVANELLNDFQYMKDIDSFEKFKSFILTPRYWADVWAISTLERILNIKIIILSEQSYDANDVDSVLKCGELKESDVENQGFFNPEYYIIVCYTGYHYKLITYKNKRIFKFTEIPYDVKALIINKCMERNAGPYYLIQDFRNFKSKLGISPDEGMPLDSDDEMEVDLYDPSIVFMFHAKSDIQPKAGTGNGENIPQSKLTEFSVLNKEKVCHGWRRKLDDSWEAPFSLDGHRWNTVEHYVLGSQYKKGFPDFYRSFSLDSETDISKDVIIARAATSKSGKLKDRVLRPKNIKIDADYNEDGVEKRKNIERRTALDAKFSQNLDLKKILMETKNAKLIHFSRGHPPTTDEMLMHVRKKLQ